MPEQQHAVQLSANSKFAKLVFRIAGIYGVLIFTPLYFLYDKIGQTTPPPLTHPLIYYSFVNLGLGFQFLFLLVSTNPIRFRPVMLIGVWEKFSYGIAATIFFYRHAIQPTDYALGMIDVLLGVLFLIAYLKTPNPDDSVSHR